MRRANPRPTARPVMNDRLSDAIDSTPDHGVTVRTFDESDRQIIAELYENGMLGGEAAPNDTGADIDNIAEAYFDDPRHHFWLADVDGQTVGMIAVGSDEDHTAEVRRLRVHPAFREKPVASCLLETALEHCKDHGFLKIRLDTRYEKTSVLDLFERAGFQLTRSRSSPGSKEVLEFYLDLYRQSDDDDATPPMRGRA